MQRSLIARIRSWRLDLLSKSRSNYGDVSWTAAAEKPLTILKLLQMTRRASIMPTAPGCYLLCE